MITLSNVDLVIAALLVLALALLSLRLQAGVSRQLLVAAARTAIQLTLIGLVLKTLFANVHLAWVTLMAVFMLLVAGREVMVRQKRRFRGWWGYALGTVSMFLSSFTVTVFALVVILGDTPWYTPQYAIPMLGQRWDEAISAIRQQAVSSGLIPIINAMAAAGVISLPGMMTGQILAGAPPVEAVKYQILIMFLITVGTGLGTLSAVTIGSRRLFDARQRLCLDRLREN
jgi:putative ABC transport system permease protein